MIRNSLNYDHKLVHGEFNMKPSATVPDLTLSIRDIFDRYARGAVLPMKEVYFDEEDDTPDLATLDLVERAEYAEYAKDEITKIRKPKIKKNAKDNNLGAPENTVEDATEAPERSDSDSD